MKLEEIRKLIEAATPGQAIPCLQCGTSFKRARMAKEHKYCSEACRYKARVPKFDKAKKAERDRLRRQRPEVKAAVAATTRRQYRKNPDKAKARATVNQAVKRGALSKATSCQTCGTEAKLEGHHHLGYEKPNWLKVEWLCKPCHVKADNHA